MKHLLIFFIHIYQFLSPAYHHLMLALFGVAPTCRQVPSCSEYTIHQIQNHGTITGLKRGLWRIAHCHSLKK